VSSGELENPAYTPQATEEHGTFTLLYCGAHKYITVRKISKVNMPHHYGNSSRSVTCHQAEVPFLPLLPANLSWHSI